MPTSASSEAAVWDPVETRPRERLRELQLERLRATVERSLARSRRWPPASTEAGVAGAREISSLDDLARLPFSRKSDLREHYPFGLLAVPRSSSCGCTPPAARTASRPSSATRGPISTPGAS